jgi:hypothetical protein
LVVEEILKTPALEATREGVSPPVALVAETPIAERTPTGGSN